MAAFEKALPRLEDEQIGVVAASTDPRDKAEATVKEHSLTYPVGYGLPLEETAATLGSFYEPTRRVLHSTGFVIKPDATIAVAQYSSGPIGRLVWQDILGLDQYRVVRYRLQACAGEPASTASPLTADQRVPVSRSTCSLSRSSSRCRRTSAPGRRRSVAMRLPSHRSASTRRRPARR